MTISVSQFAQLNCPQCGTPFTATVWLIVDAGERPDLAAKCSDGSIFVVTCPNGHSGMLAAPLLYHDRAKKQLILALPPNMDRQEAQKTGGQLINRLRSNLLILPGSEYLDAPQAVPFELLPAAIAGKLEEALAQAETQLAQARAQLEQNPALAAALRTLDENQALAQTVQDWAGAVGAVESKAFLRAHLELLTDAAEKTLAALFDLAQAQGDRDAAQVLGGHQSLLQSARRDGIDAAYVRYSELIPAGEPGPAQAALEARLRDLGVKSQHDLERAVREHPELPEMIERAMIDENPMLAALSALVDSDTPQELTEAVRDYPILLEDEAIQAIREGIVNVRRAGQEDAAQHLEQQLEQLILLKSGGL